MELNNMTTEGRNPNTYHLDEMSSLEIVTAMNREDAAVAYAIEKVLPLIAQAVSMIEYSFQNGGRLIYMGAGTSGRLGVLDASECPPTFGVDPGQVIGLIAGGERAFIRAVEGAEDRPDFGKADLEDIHLSPSDIVVGIAASGRTPYVIGGLKYALEKGCQTIAVSCNKGSEISHYANPAIEIPVGPEILTGSTRLKAGTAQKLVLNMLSTASMVRCGKAYQNLMVDMIPSNEKLRRRAEKIVMEATASDQNTACEAIDKADGQVKTAITMLLTDCEAETARRLLAQANGSVKKAVGLRQTKQEKNPADSGCIETIKKETL